MGLFYVPILYGGKERVYPINLDLVDGQKYYAFARHCGSVRGAGPWSNPVAFTARKAFIATPAVTSPANGSKLYIFDGKITVNSSAFSAQYATDTHDKSGWRITTAANGGTVVAEADESSDLLSHVFSGLTLTSNTTYYLSVRHKGKRFGWSPWSAGIAITPVMGVTAPSGRKYYRNASNTASVMIYTENGATKHLRIPDSVNRADALAWASNSNFIDTSLPNVTAIPSGSNGYFAGESSSTTGCSLITDSQIDAIFGGKGDTGTAKGNTDVIVASVSSAAAAQHCRSKTIEGVACDLPTIQQLARIFCDADFIDSLDPTASANPTLKLSGWPFSTNRAWSSTEYSNTNAWDIASYGSCDGANSKNNKYGVVPVQEVTP